jgi:diguanylate cyclase (GGDEF)-like protein
MSQYPLNEIDDLEVFAEENGVAIVVTDGSSTEKAVANNNSLCDVLSHSAEFAPDCARFCGKAHGLATNLNKPVSYECYAGLTCRAVPCGVGKKPLVAIVGRVFTKAEKYREATVRAISGDWRIFPPTEVFDNILIAGSDKNIENVAEKLFVPIEEDRLDILDIPPSEAAENMLPHSSEPTRTELSKMIEAFNRERGAQQELVERRRTGTIAEWRSLFGSIMKFDYEKGVTTILEFLARHYKLRSIVWLEARDDNFIAAYSHGDIIGKRLKVGISTNNPRLLYASRNDIPIELKERKADGSINSERRIYLFPSFVAGEVRGAFAVSGNYMDETKKRELARFTQMVATQLELMRLRGEVSHQDWLSRAVQKFNESLSNIDSADFWMNLTRLSAELLRSERASLLVRNEKTKQLEARAAVGARADLFNDPEVGERISKTVLEAGKPVVVADMEKLRIKPSPAEWEYRSSSFISYPVIIGERKVAVMNFTDRAGGGPFSEADLEFLQAISAQVAVAIDRASLKEKAGEFEQLSLTDGLTGLLNRRYLEERLDEEIKRSSRHRFPLSLLMLDVDDFKSYNDSFGHQAGDAALKIAADVIKDSLRNEDVAARYGGEEFSVMLPQTSADEAAAIAERIRSRFESTAFPFRQVTVSIGIAAFTGEPQTSAQLINAADNALYGAKRSGRNAVKLFDAAEGTSADHIH